MNLLAVPLIVMLAVVIIEGLWLSRRGPYCWRDTVLNLNSGHLPMWLLRGFEVAVFAWLGSKASLHLLEGLPLWAVAGITFLAWDFCFYWLHRMHHVVPVMWAIHEVHHQGEHFNSSLGVRNSWYSSLASIPFFAPLAIIGVPVEVFVAISTLHYSVQFFNHNGITTRMGALERWLVTPANHRVHHGCNPQYQDRNFGGTLRVWDVVFGTAQDELEGIPVQLGVPGTQNSFNPLWASNLPFLRWLNRREPHVVYGNGAGVVSDHRIAVAGVIAFVCAIYYVIRQENWTGLEPVAWLISSFLMTLAIGAMSDGRKWGLHAWLALSLAMPALFSLYFKTHDTLQFSLVLIIPIYAVSTYIHTQKTARQ